MLQPSARKPARKPSRPRATEIGADRVPAAYSADRPAPHHRRRPPRRRRRTGEGRRTEVLRGSHLAQRYAINFTSPMALEDQKNDCISFPVFYGTLLIYDGNMNQLKSAFKPVALPVTCLYFNSFACAAQRSNLSIA